MLRQVLGTQRRVLGSEHPDTLTSAINLACSLSQREKYLEAEQMLQAAIATCQRVLGAMHPITLAAADSLGNVQSRIKGPFRAESPLATKIAAPVVGRDAAAPMPAGARGLLPRLVAKLEHKCLHGPLLPPVRRQVGGTIQTSNPDDRAVKGPRKPQSEVRVEDHAQVCIQKERHLNRNVQTSG
jgi:hypothetical protein